MLHAPISPLMAFYDSHLAGEGDATNDSILMVGGFRLALAPLLERQQEIDAGAEEILTTFLAELEVNPWGLPGNLHLRQDFWPLACYLYLYRCIYEGRNRDLRSSFGYRHEMLTSKESGNLISVGCLSLHVSRRAEDPSVRFFIPFEIQPDGLVLPQWPRPRYIGDPRVGFMS